MKQPFLKVISYVVLFFVFIVNASAQEQVTKEFYKEGKYWKEVPEKKADVVKTTTVIESGTIEEWKNLNSGEVFRRIEHDEKGLPVGIWIQGKKTLDYNFTVNTAETTELLFDTLGDEQLNMLRAAAQKEFTIPRSLLNVSKIPNSWTSVYWLTIKDGQLLDVKLIKSSEDDTIDKEGVRAIKAVKYNKIFSKSENYEIELPINVKIR